MLFAVDHGNEKDVLQLTGPKTATRGQDLQAQGRSNGQDKKPFAGAKLGKVKVPARTAYSR